ncbi:hypothetical protein HPB48_019975 [Haemaphysalis longicornis]|uniref:Uncharacterized protein n=1 Tax=Haemaphysalis longicornis TaxID=44386 RepID=A0A9J6FA93_HAELO|nr:hypothetical protein HPB48_019975 [Haemaphysalis longicornis]
MPSLDFFIIISTPPEDRGRSYGKIVTLTVQGKQCATSTHVAPPAITTTGVMYNARVTNAAEQVLKSIRHYNPDLQILNARRLNSFINMKLHFHGPGVPFWFCYRAATYRFKPFRRKVEACTAWWPPGHRQGVSRARKLPRAAQCVDCAVHPTTTSAFLSILYAPVPT